MLIFLVLSIIASSTLSKNPSSRFLQTRIGSEFQIQTSRSGISNLDIASIPTGGFIAVWQELLTANDYNIYAQIYSNTGTSIGSLLQVAKTSKNEILPKVAVSDSRITIVFLYDVAQDGVMKAYYMSYNLTGAAILTAVAPCYSSSNFTFTDMSNMSISSSGINSFLIIWVANMNLYGRNVVYSILTNDVFVVNAAPIYGPVGYYANPTAAMIDSTRFFVVFYEAELLMFTIVDSSTLTMGEMNVYPKGRNPSIKLSPKGGLVLFEQYSTATLAYDRTYGMFLDLTTGAVIGSAFEVYYHTSGSSLNPHLVVLNGGSFMVTMDCADSRSLLDIYAMKLDANGNVVKQAFLVNDVIVNNERGNSISLLSNGNVVIGWDDYNSGSDTTIKKAKFFTTTDSPITFLNNQVKIKQYQKILIDDTMIKAIGNGTLTYTYDVILSVYFVRLPYLITITNFTQTDIDNRQIMLVQDGSSITPYIQLTCTSGSTTESSKTHVIFTLAPYWASNHLIGDINSRISLTPCNFFGESYDSVIMNFTVIQCTNCQFELASNVGVAITSFTPEQISRNEVLFYGTTNPYYQIMMYDFDVGVIGTGPYGFYSPMQVIKAEFTIAQGSTIPIDETMLITSFDARLNYVIYLLYNVQNGYFSYKSNPLEPITSFFSYDLTNRSLLFTHDGSLQKPVILMGVESEVKTTDPFYCLVNFQQKIALVNNILKINTGELVTITTNMISGSSLTSTNSEIYFKVTNIKHGHFQSPGRGMNFFTQQNVIDGAVMFLHDGSQYAPSFEVAIGDSNIMSNPVGSLIYFNGQDPPPISSANNFFINQGEIVFLQAINIDARDTSNSDFVFLLSSMQNCYFSKKTAASTPITRFLLSEVKANVILLVPDGTTNPPSFDFMIQTLNAVTSGVLYNAKIAFNCKPTLITNSLQINRNQKKVLNSNTIYANDLENDDGDLIFSVKKCRHGYFAYLSDPTTEITRFKQFYVMNGLIVFVHDGSMQKPSYQVSVWDGSVKIGPETSVVDFLFTNGISEIKKQTSLEGELVRSLAVNSNNTYAFAAFYKGRISVIDIINPEKPVLLENCTLDLEAKNIVKLVGMIFQENLLYIASETATLTIVNVTDPVNPKLLGSVGRGNTVLDICVCSNNYSYMAASIGGIHVVSVANKNSPTLTQTVTMNGYSIISLTCVANNLFLVTNDPLTPRMVILDISGYRAPYPSKIGEIPITSQALYVRASVNGKSLFVGHNQGIDIIDISTIFNLASVFIVSTIRTAYPISSLDGTDDSGYLIGMGENSVIAINVQDPKTPVALLDSLPYEYKLYQVLYIPRSDYILFAAIQGFRVIKIFRGQRNRISPQIALLTDAMANATQSVHIATYSDHRNYFIVMKDLNSNGVLGVLNGNRSLNYGKIAKRIAFSCSYLAHFFILAPKVDTNTVYVIACGFLHSVSLSPLTIAQIKASLNLGSPWGAAISMKDEYIYVTNNETRQLIIIQVGNTGLTLLQKNVSLPGVPKMLVTSNDDKFVYVVLEGTGLAFVDVTDKTNPYAITLPAKIANIGDVRSLVYYKNTWGNAYLIVTLYYEGMIKIVEVTNAGAPILLSHLYTGGNTMGIGLFPNKNFVVVQSNENLKVVEIRNASFPVIVDNYTSTTMTPVYQILVTEDSIIYPTNEVLDIYNGATFYYPDLTSHTNRAGEKKFVVELFPVNPKTLDKTQEKVQLLKLETDEQWWPFWMNMNFDTNYLTITPPSLESLKVMRKVKLVFGTEVLSSELAAIWSADNGQSLQAELLFQNFIDSMNIPTRNFNPAIPIVFNNTAFNSVKSLVTDLLNSHIKSHYITFTLQDFVDLDTPPKSNMGLYKQWNAYVTSSIEKKTDFQFRPESFVDPDGDKMTYSVSGVPSFLQFYKENLKLYGTPTKNDLGVYNAMITADDGYKNMSQKLLITVNDNAPICVFPGNFELRLGENLDWELPPSTFSDPDGDPLTYSIKVVGSSNQEVFAPSWLNLDSSRIRLFGKPEAKDIAVDMVNRRYYQIFLFRMTAKDTADKTCSVDFKLTVTNYFPVYNSNLTLQSQFERVYGSYVKLKKLIDFEFATDTFLDREFSPLNYTISGCPKWLTFSGNTLYGTTKKEYLGNYSIEITASDGYSNVTGILLLSVQNHPPQAYPIADQVLIFGHQLNLSFVDTDAFTDPENDNLTFKAFTMGSNGIHVNLSDWMTFHSENFSFNGFASKALVPFNSTEKRYFKEERVCLFAYDAGDENSSTCFNLAIKSNLPYENPKKSLAYQFWIFQPAVSVNSEIILEPDTFLDLNNDNLTYSIRLVSAAYLWVDLPSQPKFIGFFAVNGTMALPSIMKWDPEFRKLTISPTYQEFLTAYTIRVIARNTMLENYVDLSFTVGMSAYFGFIIFLIVIGAVLLFIVLFVLRNRFYAVFWKELYSSPDFETAKIYEPYKKIFYLIRHDLNSCLEIWKIIKDQYKSENRDVSQIFYSTNREEVLKKEIIDTIEFLKKKDEAALDPYINTNSTRIMEIFDSFLILEALKKEKKAKAAFEKLKKSMERDRLRNWYDSLVIISEHTRGMELEKPFPLVTILEQNLRQAFSEALKGNKTTKLFEQFNEKEQLLIKGAIKAHVLGIPCPGSLFDTFMEFSRGESIWVLPNEIAEIHYEKVSPATFYIYKGFFDISSRKMYSPVQNWLKYEISEDMLIFEGTPAFADCGKYIISIFNKDGTIIREFGVEATSKGYNLRVKTTTPSPLRLISPVNRTSGFMSDVFSPEIPEKNRLIDRDMTHEIGRIETETKKVNFLDLAVDIAENENENEEEYYNYQGSH